MAEQRPAFRFRLPWLSQSSPAARRPTTAPEPRVQAPSTTTTQTPAAPTPAQRPPFRPPGIAQGPTAPTQAPPVPTTSTQPPPVPTTTPQPAPAAPTPRQLVPTASTQPPPVPTMTPQQALSTPTPQPAPAVPTPRQLLPTASTQPPQVPTMTPQPGLSTPTPPQPVPIASTQLPPMPTTTPQRPSVSVGTRPTLVPAVPSPAPTPAPQQPRVPLPLLATSPPARTAPPPLPPTPPPPPAVQSSSSIESKPDIAKLPANNAQPTTETSGPTTPPQRSPPRPPRLAQAQPSPPKVPTSAKTESEPSSPSHARTQSRVSAQPPSPSRMATQPRVSSKPPSPSRGVTQSRATSQPSSPGRSQPSQTTTPPRSPSQMASQPAAKTPSSPSSPIISTVKMQPKDDAVSQPAQPPSTVINDTAQASPSFKAMEARPKEITPETEKPEAIIKEVEGKEKRRIEASGGKTSTDISSEIPNSETLTKERPRITIQETEQKQPESLEVIGRKEKWTTSSIPYRAQTKTVISHPLDKLPVSESPQKRTPVTGEQPSLQKEIRDDISKFIHKMATNPSKQSMDEKPVSVITLTGDNRGATMHIGSEATKREGGVHIHRGYKLNPDESADTTDGEQISKGKKLKKDSDANENQEPKAYVNSNVQGINNSMVFNSSVAERNPGVHLSFSRNLDSAIKLKNKHKESMGAHKAEVNLTPSRKLTYEPTIRRRCLRGLFLEPSDSDTDDPEKPRRHGCRYSCGEKSNKDNEIDVL